MLGLDVLVATLAAVGDTAGTGNQHEGQQTPAGRDSIITFTPDLEEQLPHTHAIRQAVHLVLHPAVEGFAMSYKE